ncbi:polar amino acid transport system substrate-binding protein [Rhizobium pisi]
MKVSINAWRHVLRTAVAMAAITLAAGSASAGAIGQCELTGTKGEIPFKTAQADELTVVTNLPSPGWWNGDTVETIADGYEYCFAANIAHRAGYDKVKVVNVPFDAIVAGRVKDFDLALAQISITDARKKVVDFSIPYFSSDIGVVVKKGTKLNSTSIKQMRVGVKQATTGAQFISDKIKPASVKVFPDSAGLFAALMAGQIDAAVHDTSIVLGQAAESQGKLEVAGQYSTGESYGAIYPKESSNGASIDKIVETLEKDGTLKKLASKYLSEAWGIDPTSIPYLKP